MSLTKLKYPVSVEKILRVLKKDGCVILEGLTDINAIISVSNELEPYFNQTPNCEGYFWGYNTKRMGGLIAKSKSSHEFIIHPLILNIVQAILGPYCSRFQLNLTQAIKIEPGEIKQVLHRDHEVFPFEKKGECLINVMWALDDFTGQNGATRVVPGSHVHNLERDPEEGKVVSAEMPRGSALIYLGSLTHSGGANQTNKSRTGMAIGYSLGWLRQAENQYLAIPPEKARNLPNELSSLIGYAIHEPNLGWFEGQDPAVLLNGPRPTTLPARDYIPTAISEKLKARQERLLEEKNLSRIENRKEVA